MNNHRKLIIAIAFLPLHVNAEPREDGEFGYYWKTSHIVGSTSYEAAMAECDLYKDSNPSCVDVALQSAGETYAYYKRVLSNGQLSYNQVEVTRRVCDQNTNFLASCQEGYGEPELCSDGHPPNLNGWYGCDRPDLKQCENGEYVNASSFCPESPSVCQDYDSCYNYAYNDSSCNGATYFEFNYSGPRDWNFTCTQIAQDSPDNPNNGGNADGNEDNDPSSTTTSISELDANSLATAIDNSLQDNFGSVERAIREGSSNIEDAIRETNTNQEQYALALENALDDLNINTGDGLASLETSINQRFNELNDNNGNGMSDIQGAVEDGNLTLHEISAKLDQLQPCEPTQQNNHCENHHGLDSDFITTVVDAIDGTYEQESTTATDQVKAEIEDIKNNSPFADEIPDQELRRTWDYFIDIWPTPQDCVPLRFGNSQQIWSFTIDCKFSNQFKAIFGFLLAIYTIQYLIEILFTGIKPKG